MKITDLDIPKQAFIYAAIHLLSNRLQVIGNKVDPTISEKQWFVLAAVSKYKEALPNIGDIAKGLGTSRQNIKKMASILEQRGFLKIEKDKNDLRNLQLSLTTKCLDYFEGRKQQEDEYIKGIFHDIDEEMLDALCQGMARLMNNIDSLLTVAE